MRDWATEALRNGSLATLRGGLIDELRHYAGYKDFRDVLISLAPYHDCARRLGADAAVLFAEAAAVVPKDVGELAIEFGQRNDVTLAAFGWSVIKTPEGPAYRFAW